MRTFTISNAWPERLERSVKGAMRQAVGGHIHYMTVMLVKNPGVRPQGSRPGLSFGRSVMGYDFMSLVCARVENGIIRGTVADCWAKKSYEVVIPLGKMRWVHLIYEACPHPYPLPKVEGTEVELLSLTKAEGDIRKEAA
ncbi:hypothetical protein [Desulforegula conservatrix]|uniref:hypothetical protein n=1 Tax=Desulforegula conservatrix TaxID=153026 RepID=UPI0004127068|nr:hypothetical protein [Desulforegula conservatrix]